MTSIAALMAQTPTLGNVNSQPSFGFKSSSSVRADYSNKPGVSALMNPTLHNNVPESMVNSTARAPIFVRPFTRGYEKQYSEGDVLFVKREKRGGMDSGQHHVVANIPVMNYMLRTEMNEDGKTLKYTTIESIIKDWNYFGILNNDMDTGSKWQRLLNVNVRGRSRVARLWRPVLGHLRRGDCLWIGFQQQEKCEKPESRQDPSGIRHPLVRDSVYYEVVPIMDCCKDFNDIEYKIPLGIVSQTTLKQPHPNSLKEALYVTEKCKSLERIEVLMRI